MAVKKAKTSLKEVLEAEQRVLADAPQFFQEDQEDVLKYYPSGIGFVKAKYRTEGGSETTARGTVLPYEEAIPQTQALTVEMSQTRRDTRTGLIQERPIVETMKLPFRTDNCAMNIKHKVKSHDLIGALMMFPGYNRTFEIEHVTVEQKRMEKALKHEATLAVINATQTYTDAATGEKVKVKAFVGADDALDGGRDLDKLKKRD